MKVFAVLAVASVQARNLCMFMCPMNLEEVCGSDGNTYGKLIFEVRLGTNDEFN